MATPTSTRPGDTRTQDDYDSQFDEILKGEHTNDQFNEIAKGLGDLEDATTDGTGDYGQPAASSADGSDIAKAQDLSTDEGAGNPLTTTNFTSSVEPKDIIQKVSKLKKFAPTIGISGLIIGVVAGLSMLLSPSMLFIHIKETLVDKFNIQSAALDARSNKILAKKMASMTTSCSKLTYACKMNSLNKTTLEKMKHEGIIAVDKNGKEIEIKSNYGSERPAGYRIQDMDSLKLSEVHDADAIRKLMSTDPSVAGRFRNVFDVRWSAFWDENFSGFMARENLKRSGSLKGGTEEEIKANYDAAADGKTKTTSLSADAKASDGSTDPASTKAATTELDGAITSVAQEGDATAEKVAQELTADAVKKVGKSGGAMLIASLYCGAGDFISAVGKATRAAQIAQGIGIAFMFVQVADEIKSNNTDQAALAAKTAVLGGMLTAVMKNSKGEITKKSAMESDGMGYLLRRDKPNMTGTGTSDIRKYIPGGWSSNLLNVTAATSNPQTKQACALFNSTGGQLAQLALDFNPIGIIMFVGTTVFADQIAKAVEPMIGGLVKSLAGKVLDSKTVAEDLGNVLGVYLPMLLGEAANATALMGFGQTTTGQTSALQYAKLNDNVRLANARIDQATKSPLDATSPNTALGSIVSSILPYYSSFSSVSGAASSISTIVGSSLSNILSPATHADNSELVGDCPDPSIKAIAGPVCNIIYGAPVDALTNTDPSDVISHLSAQIDETSGEAKADSALKKWIDLCATGSGTSVYEKDCVLDDADLQSGKPGKTITEKVYYILYFIDRRVQRDMDGEDAVDGNTAAGYAASTSATATSADGLQAPSGKVVSPIEPGRNDIQMSAKYGHYASGGVHFGVDLAGRSRYNVVSACDGTVKAVDVNPVYANSNARGVTGSTNYLWIDCGNNVYMGYAHFFQSDLKPYITAGAKIGAGTILFPEGNQGNSSGYHLHFQVSTVGSTAYTAAATTDPAAYLAKFGIQLPKPSY